MTPAETAGLTAAEIVEYVIGLAPTIAALGIWFFGFVMWSQNRSRAAQAAEDRKAAQAQAAQAAAQAAEDRAQAAEDRAQAAEDRKVTQGMLAALQELLRRTSPPRPGPAE